VWKGEPETAGLENKHRSITMSPRRLQRVCGKKGKKEEKGNETWNKTNEPEGRDLQKEGPTATESLTLTGGEQRIAKRPQAPR